MSEKKRGTLSFTGKCFDCGELWSAHSATVARNAIYQRVHRAKRHAVRCHHEVWINLLRTQQVDGRRRKSGTGRRATRRQFETPSRRTGKPV